MKLLLLHLRITDKDPELNHKSFKFEKREYIENAGRYLYARRAKENIENG